MLARINGDAAVTVAHGRLEVAVKRLRPVGRLVQNLRLGADLLQAHDVGRLLAQPVEQPLVGGRSNAVDVERNDSHRHTMSWRFTGAGSARLAALRLVPPPRSG